MSAPERLPALDEMRGLAILGTFAANVWLFAAVGGPAALLLGGLDPGVLQVVLQQLVNGKFLALLTLLFGVGMELQYSSAVRRGVRWPGRYLWRAGLLFVEGLLHYVLVFEFDVLMGYAIASVVVAYLVGRTARTQVVAASVAGAFLLLVVGAVTAAGFAPSSGAAGAPPYPAGYLDQVLARLVDWPLFRIELVVIVPGAVILFLVGARLARAGAFTATTAGERIRRRMLAVGGLGVTLNVLTTVAGPAWFAVDRYLCAPLVGVGLAALVTTVVLRMNSRRAERGTPERSEGGHQLRRAERGTPERSEGGHQHSSEGPVRRGLVSVGRTAMSCYVLQNVVAAAVFYAWGLGLAGGLAGAGEGTYVASVVGVWALVCIGSAVAATAWLRRFDRGPLELATHAALRALPVRAATPGRR